MPRVPLVPEQLTRRPFTIAEAHSAGLDRWHLQGSSWRRHGAGTYSWTGLRESVEIELGAAQERLPQEAVFSGLTAAWLHGLDVEACSPIEVTVSKSVGISGRAGLLIRRSELGPKDIVRMRGFTATCIGRTLKDVCRRLSLTESVVIADMAAHAGLIDAAGLAAAAMHYRRLAGIARFREVVGHVEPEAESRMETRLRMLLVLNGLPRPQAQVPILDDAGVVIGRPDLYYPDRRLGIEYDGSTHRDSLTADNRRQNRLLDAGVTLLRFSAGDISQTPQAVVRLVRSMLAA